MTDKKKKAEAEVWYFVGYGVLGSGKQCVHRGGIVPVSMLSQKRLQHFVDEGKISDKPIPIPTPINSCEDDLQKAKLEIKHLNEVVQEIKDALAVAKHNWVMWQNRYKELDKEYEDLKKKCKNK
jgi:hypothetical protein